MVEAQSRVLRLVLLLLPALLAPPALCMPEGDAPASYAGAQLLRVNASTPDHKDTLKRLEESGAVELWSGIVSHKKTVDVLVKPDKEQEVKQKLRKVRAEYAIVINNLQDAIQNENPVISEEEMLLLEGRKGHRMTWHSYHRISDLHGYLDFLAQTYPQLCSVITIGNSVEGRPLKVLKISPPGSTGQKAIWIDGGIHAREWISPASVSFALKELVENFEAHFHGQESTLGSMDWYFLPIANPDGYEHTHSRDRLWRKNRLDAHKGSCAGTDLNRNFGYRWGGQGSSRDPCREIYAGRSAFSEPESAAISNFVKSKASIMKAYVTFHSYGQYILYPWGYDRKVPPDYRDLNRVGQKMAQAIRAVGGSSYTVGSSATTLYPASGGSDDWAKGSAKIKYTYTVELRDTGRYGFILPAEYITPTGKEALAAIKVVAEAASQEP
ncbi:carboxypeptidase B-like [Ischnura elegans]|uniref:carboxypeptidase B-like n=1 Tax=Ischnura elegans TaxID=197161 RepID=UPI001ED89467|nr:carboxypeptidase B-like [Ischnura elegans]